MSDTATNKVQIHDAGPCRKKISIEIPAAVVDETIGESFATVAHEAALPGFRKGRAPKRLIERRFGGYVRNEARGRLISQAYQDAVESHNLKVLGQPPASAFENVEVEAGKPLTLELEVEVMPEFDLPELKGIKILKPDATLPEGMVDDEIKKICVNEGTLEDRDTPEPGDYLMGKAVMTDAEGAEHYNIDGAVVQVPPADGDGSGMILGVLVANFAEQVGTPKAGDEITIKVNGPENHEVEALRGKDLSVAYTVANVYKIIPAPLADLVAKFGLTGEDQLREMVAARLQQRAEIQQQSVMRQQIARHLSDNTTFDLPEGLTSQQAARNLERRRMELMYRGVDQREIETHMAELRAASAQSAVRELKQFFILNKAAEQLDVQVDEQELNAQIYRIAQEQGQRPDAVRDALIKNGQIQTLFQQVREHKTLDAVLADAAIEEVSADEFNKRMKEATAS
ncbi:MAG: trigger factor [Phycisphaerales bacterium]|nr:trigger factor [Planctomycetota bacterium]MCH8508661.1 trigger factor [Phycisphaerales bacterium]